MSKISQTEGYNSLYSHDFICISETYFDSTIFEDKRFHLNGYNLEQTTQIKQSNEWLQCQIFILVKRRQNNNGRYTFGSTYIFVQLSLAYIRTQTSTNSCIDCICILVYTLRYQWWNSWNSILCNKLIS